MKRIILIIFLVFNISCMNLSFFLSPLYKLSESKREAKIESLYNTLNKEYYLLLEDEIKEKDRLILEEKFQKINDEIEKVIKEEKILEPLSNKHKIFLEKYLKEIKIKLQYLKDLK